MLPWCAKYVRIADVPEFEGLSYCCGKPKAPSWISVGNKKLRVTRKVKLALNYLWRKDSSRKLWTDAISIH